MEVAQAVWLDHPKTSPVFIQMTLRQFNIMSEMASAAPNQPLVRDFINEQFSKFVEAK